MTYKAIIGSLVSASLLVPVAATAATAGFYVAQDAKTHKCMVTDKKPDSKTMSDVGTKLYASKADAEIALSKLAACK